MPIVVDASRGAIVLPHDLAHCEHRARAGMRTGPVPRPAPGRLWTTGPSAGPP
ncbi:XRE family transcriptional regulator [Actinomyces sp. oral taxon 448 str. F0400]|nr:XRE family transcriptional regulator [Actinomyces sp. oral taxon 448 str. F0400]